MEKILIPSILGITILIAGFFAISPIEQATTVHSASLIESNTGGVLQSFLIESGNGAGITDGDTVVIDCDNDFYVMDMYWEIDDYDGIDGEQLSIGSGDANGNFITVDGTKLIAEDEDSSTTFDMLNPTGTAANNVNVKISWAARAFDELSLAGTPGDINLSTDLFAIGAGNNDIVITIEDNGGNTFDLGDTLTVTALIQTQSNADCSVTVNT